MRQMDVPVGRVVYTPMLTPSGGFKADLTIMRLGDDVFRVVTGGAYGMSDLKWFADHLSGRRLGTDSRPDELAGARSGCGARARATSCPASPPTMSPTRGCRSRAGRRSRSDRWRCSPAGSPMSAISGGSCTSGIEQGAKLWDIDRRGGRATRRGPRRRGRVRHDRAPGEVLPGVRRRTGRRVQRRRGRDGVGQGQGPGLRRQGGPCPPPRGGAGGEHVHADRRRPHVELGREALHDGR